MGAIGAQFVQHVARKCCVSLFVCLTKSLLSDGTAWLFFAAPRTTEAGEQIIVDATGAVSEP